MFHLQKFEKKLATTLNVLGCWKMARKYLGENIQQVKRFPRNECKRFKHRYIFAMNLDAWKTQVPQTQCIAQSNLKPNTRRMVYYPQNCVVSWQNCG